jgi:uncharacterized protein YndB with AHSA1/START domain
MKSFSCRTTIRATPERIWAILTDAARYPAWNPTVTSIDGRIAPGERIAVHMKLNPGRAFRVAVAEFVPPSRMVWRGGMPLGLFTGERVFALTPSPSGTVDFAMLSVVGATRARGDGIRGLGAPGQAAGVHLGLVSS